MSDCFDLDASATGVLKRQQRTLGAVAPTGYGVRVACVMRHFTRVGNVDPVKSSLCPSYSVSLIPGRTFRTEAST